MKLPQEKQGRRCQFLKEVADIDDFGNKGKNVNRSLAALCFVGTCLENGKGETKVSRISITWTRAQGPPDDAQVSLLYSEACSVSIVSLSARNFSVSLKFNVKISTMRGSLVTTERPLPKGTNEGCRENKQNEKFTKPANRLARIGITPKAQTNEETTAMKNPHKSKQTQSQNVNEYSHSKS